MQKGFVSGTTPLDYSPHGVPWQERQPPPLPDPTRVTAEKKWNRRMARYYRSHATPATRARAAAIGQDT